MSDQRLIDANDLQEFIKDYCGDYVEHGPGAYSATAVRAAINMAPTIDAVQVVRCKDCDLAHPDRRCRDIKNALWCDFMDMPVGREFYCATGERRAANHDPE